MGAVSIKPRSRSGIDETLWMRVCTGADAYTDSEIERIVRETGPIHPQGDDLGIELWTERELSALHALWDLGVIAENPAWRGRAIDAARWHIRNTQPDNATNHPWAIHVFLDLWSREKGTDSGAEARLYADTLLHNCRAMSAAPTPLSALILLDAADGLDRGIASGGRGG